jgi:hypothetical protein
MRPVMCRTRRPFRQSVALEPLEPRTLLSGVTIITHGAEFLSTARPSWIDYMASAIRTRVGSSTAIYALRMVPGSGGIVASGFARLAGPSPSDPDSTSTNGETVLLLDWAAASSVNLFTLHSDHSTTQVATAVIPYLTNAFPDIGLSTPLVEGAIQLIGHSRGASLISEIARMLGQRGIWVDQLTTLDPVPVSPDPGVVLKSNVIFSDNYYQKSGDGLFTPNGSAIGGAYNVGPLKLGGAYGALDGSTHGDVHLFYQGTINTAANAYDGSESVVGSWYPNNNLTRAKTGFYFSRLGGGTLPASGLSSAFGGAAGRSVITHVGTQWPNLATVTLPSDHVGESGLFSATYRYNSYNTATTISWFLDPDTNPYNGNSIVIADPLDVSGTGDAPIKVTANFQATAAAGTYYLEGQITNATGTRYAYSSAFSFGNLPPTGTIKTALATATTITGTAVDPDWPDTTITIRADADGTTFYTGPADLPQGGSSHGFSVDLTGLPAGFHRIDLYALDATSSSPAFIGSRVVYTNALPTGRLDSFDGSTLIGWALDPNSGTAPSQILYKVDSNPPLLATADAARPDLDPNASSHGFSVTLPQLKAGVHTVTVYAVDATSSKLVLLGRKSATVKNPAGNNLPTGNISSATTIKITGTVADATIARRAVTVRIDIDGVAGSPFLSTLAARGNQATFTVPLSLSPGQHRVEVYAYDTTTDTPVRLGSRVVGTAAPRGALQTATATDLIGWAYSAALGGNAASYRIDVDTYAGNVLTTDVTRDVPNTVPLVNGPFGFGISTPPMATGRHTVSLYYIDPLTLTATKLAAKTLVTTA